MLMIESLFHVTLPMPCLVSMNSSSDDLIESGYYMLIPVTEPTRREACGSICKALLDRDMVITGMVQTVANRYIEDKTDEYSSQQAWSSIGEQYPEGLTRGVIR